MCPTFRQPLVCLCGDETRLQGGLGALEASVTFSADALPPDALRAIARGYIDELAMGSGVSIDAFTEIDGPEIGAHTVWRRAELPSQRVPGTITVYVVLFDGPTSLARVTAAGVSGTFNEEDVAPFAQMVAGRLF